MKTCKWRQSSQHVAGISVPECQPHLVEAVNCPKWRFCHWCGRRLELSAEKVAPLEPRKADCSLCEKTGC